MSLNSFGLERFDQILFKLIFAPLRHLIPKEKLVGFSRNVLFFDFKKWILVLDTQFNFFEDQSHSGASINEEEDWEKYIDLLSKVKPPQVIYFLLL